MQMQIIVTSSLICDLYIESNSQDPLKQTAYKFVTVNESLLYITSATTNLLNKYKNLKLILVFTQGQQFESFSKNITLGMFDVRQQNGLLVTLMQSLRHSVFQIVYTCSCIKNTRTALRFHRNQRSYQKISTVWTKVLPLTKRVTSSRLFVEIESSILHFTIKKRLTYGG